MHGETHTTAVAGRVINPTGPLPGGVDNFAEVMGGGYCFIDKSLLIQEAFTCDKKVMLITRPRRFGKTINLSMLRYFFDNASPVAPLQDIDLKSRFARLLIAQDQQAMQHQGKYPVIHMTFKSVKASTWEDAYELLRFVIRSEIDRHPESKQSDVSGFGEKEQEIWQRILTDKASRNDWQHSLFLLCKLLCLHHKRPAWIFLDEYDRPIHEAYIRCKQRGENIEQADSYYDKMIVFMRGLLGEALKGNDFLFRSVITGILRIAKEGIFSEVNNLGVYGVLDNHFASHFGFHQTEVDQVLTKRNLQHRAELVKQFYNGYRFGNETAYTVYNPWSVISYLGDPTNNPQTYWVNTGGADILHSLQGKYTPADRQAMEALLAGNTVTQDVADDMPLRELEAFSSPMHSLLLTSGYLTASHLRPGVLGKKVALRIPNKEVRTALQRLVMTWFKQLPTNELLTALQQSKPEEFARQLDLFARASLSYFDIQPHEPEWVYHMLLLGMLSHVVTEYHIRSNREAGDGRPDIVMVPLDLNLTGVIMEFKQAANEQELEQAAQKALDQIQANDYSADFVNHPPKGILQLGISFCGKHTCVKHLRLTS